MPYETALGYRIRAARLQAGLTVKTAAKITGVSTTTWTNWERCIKRPASPRMGAIARALGVPVCSFYVDEGYLPVTEVVLTPGSVERLRREGRPAAEELARLVASQLAPAILAAASPPRSRPARAVRRRRSREEILRGIEAAKQARARRQAVEAAWQAGGLVGPTAEE
jgi:transcriptional regulator with XRE-family HTH domain